MTCEYCQQDVVSLSMNGHLNRCIFYLKIIRTDIQKCSCGFKPSSLFERRLHRDSCLVWNLRAFESSDTIICTECKTEKTSDEFYNNKIKKNRKDSKCKTCRIKSSKSYSADLLKQTRRVHYIENAEISLLKKKIYYQKNKELISQKRSLYIEKHKGEITQKIKTWRIENQSLLRERSKNYRHEIINLVLDMLGPVCILCGEANREFLTVDHVYNNGNTERKLSSIGWKRRILTGESSKDDYQVLCHNCNQKKYKLNPIHHLSKKPLIGVEKECHLCKKQLDLSLFCSQKSHSKNFCLSCRLLQKKTKQKFYMLSIGTACQCCGNADFDSLVLDHVNNDGSMRRKNGEKSGVNLYRKVYYGEVKREDFQILCWNCNFSKHQGKGLCWHQRHGESLLDTPKGKTISIPTHSNDEQIEFKFGSIIFQRVDSNDDVKKFMNDYHYAKFGRPSNIIYVAKLKMNIIGIAKFSTPVRQGIAPSLGIANNELLELDRFCIHPNYHKKNFASYFVSKILKLVLIDNSNIKKFVAFADPRFGHLGVIYKATNWKYVGVTSRSYYYVDKDGMEINKKVLYEYAIKHKFKEKECAQILGYIKVHTPPKHKYVYEV